MSELRDEADREQNLDYGDECGIPIGSAGATVRCDSYDDNPAGASYVRVVDAEGREIAYWNYEEWAEDPGLVMGAIMGAMKGAS